MLTHIVISSEPLIGESDCRALCGKMIRNPLKVWTAAHTGKTAKEIFSALLNCRKCWEQEWGDGYVYGMVNGGDLRPTDSGEC